MPSEPFVFLLVALLTEVGALALLARRSPRELPVATGWLAVPFLAIFGWFLSLLARDFAAPGWVTGFTASLVVTTWAGLWLDLDIRRRYGLRFYPTGIRAYEEKGIRARCLDSWISRWLGTSDALAVTVTLDELWVRPLRPLPAAACGLIHRIPLRRIHLMERLSGPDANVRLEYAGQDGWCRCVELQLRNPNVFIHTVREGQLAEIEVGASG